jgi:hypothetical protein
MWSARYRVIIATSAAVTLGPATDAARSPESRVKVKLMTRTVRQINAAMKAPWTRNKRIRDHFDGRRGPGKRGTEELISNLGFN